AVMCAVSIQKATEEINIPLRIGIHQGDVIFEKKDVLGDGVNIASRIQGLADSNDIAISERVYDDIKNKEGLTVELLGEHRLKGVKKPTTVYKVSIKDDSLLDFNIDTGELVRPLSFRRSTIVAGIMIIALLAFALYYFLPKIIDPPSEEHESLLVLPFNNYLGTDTVDYIVAGMHSELISDIQKISALNVKSKYTANTFKNANKSIPEIAQELGVNIFVEGAVLCMGDTVCFEAKLIDQREKVLWTHEYKVERSQILSLYKKVTKDIAERINTNLTPKEEEFLAKTRLVDQEVYDAYLKSFQFLGDASLPSLNKSLENLNFAIEKDPDWAPLYSGLGGVWLTFLHMGHASPSVAVSKIYENLNKALELDPDLSDAHRLSAMVAQLMEWNWEKSEKVFLRALALNPNDAYARIFYAQFLSTMQRPEEARMQGKLAYGLDPLNPMMKCWYGGLLIGIGDCETALAVAEEVVAIDPEHWLANSVIGEAAFQCGNYKRGFEADIICLKPILEKDIIESIQGIFRDKGLAAATKEISLQLEVYAGNNPMGPVGMAISYIKWNQFEKVMDWLEKGYEMHDPQMIYITTHMYHFEPLFDNPRFLDIVEKMNLPLP
ncbi:MAG: adenylate/guanylate cyclase domain-containing protein, partial [Cyclobacteriaceae bacterium]